ncbi:MAG: phage portal protein [Bacteroidaceae bacterium]|nr:phage portal protein [Bacteroidaceae bacterium]
MYTLPKDTKITCQILNDVIAYNELLKKRFDRLEAYYLGMHDILARDKDGRLKNNKVVVNHAKYITDTNVGYLLGNPVDYQPSEGHDIEPLLDAYKKQTINDLDTEIAKDVSIFGMQYEYVYANENAEPKSCEVDNRNAIIVYDDTVEHNKLFGLIYRPIKEGNTFKYWEIIYVDKQIKRTYKSFSKRLQQVGVDEPHAFGDVPLICYKNNPECMGDYEPVISLIDAYNLLQSDRVNDKEQLVDAILCLYGMDFDAEQADMLRESRMLANIPADGKVEYLVKTLQEADVDVLRQNIEADIHKISMVPNMSDENFMGNSSGVAIRYKLLAFEQNVKNKERYMEKGLMERFKLYNHFLFTQSKMAEVPIEEVDAVFKRNLPSNDFEISQMINNLVDLVDAETLLSQLSFIKDASEIVALKAKEDEARPKAAYDEAFSNNEMGDANVGKNQEDTEMAVGAVVS